MIPSETIYSPSVPFVDYFGMLRPGCSFTVQGHIFPYAQSFEINLACGNVREGPMISDIGIQIKSIVNMKCVTLNTLQNKCWGPHQQMPGRRLRFPFTSGTDFELVISVTAMHYMVCVNGVQLVTYNHRMPMERVNTLQIMGEVQINRILFQDPMYSKPCMPTPSIQQPVYTGCPASTSLMVPFVRLIPGGMYLGRTIHVSGHPTAVSDRFAVNLLCATHYKGPNTIALHFNPRFDETAVVRNTHQHGTWGDEERSMPYFPFSKNPVQNFDLRIVCETDKFAIYIKGQHFCNYRHRLPYNYIESIEVSGDVVVTALNF